MHFVISWDIHATGDEWNKINEALKVPLAPYSWVRPLSTFYIVNVNSQDVAKTIYNGVYIAAASFPGKVNFIMSPAMNGGKYEGSLPQNIWDEVNKRSL